MTNKLVIIGPHREERETEWFVTAYDEINGDEVVVTIDGEQVAYPMDSEYVTFAAEAEAKHKQLLEQFNETNFERFMEVVETMSGSIKVRGL